MDRPRHHSAAMTSPRTWEEEADAYRWPVRLALLTAGLLLWIVGATVALGVLAPLLTTVGYALMVGGAVGLAVLNRP